MFSQIKSSLGRVWSHVGRNGEGIHVATVPTGEGSDERVIMKTDGIVSNKQLHYVWYKILLFYHNLEIKHYIYIIVYMLSSDHEMHKV